MRKISAIVFSLFLLIIVSCEKQAPGTFQISLANKVWITDSDIESYDFSSQLIYLKQDDLFTINPAEFFRVYKGPFEVQLDGRKIYEGTFHASYASTMPFGAYISVPQFYSRDIIHIAYSDTSITNLDDPRNDDQIISAMKKLGLYRAGLSCTIDEIKVNKNDQDLNTSEVQFTFTVKNNDPFNYYIPDPDLMGNELFHYFTNGLYFVNPGDKKFYSYIGESISPQPWDDWKIQWLYLLKKGEQISRTLILQKYEYIAPGEYSCSFSYPGLSHRISKEERARAGGKIWMGNISATKIIQIKE